MRYLIGVIFKKELVDHTRDRRTMTTAFILPLLGPILVYVVLGLVAGWVSKDKTVHVGIVGEERAPNLGLFLRRTGIDVTPAPPQFRELVKSGKLDAVVVVGDDYARKFEKGEPAPVSFYADESQNAARNKARRARGALDAYGGQVGAGRLLVRGIAPELARPLAVEDIEIATSQELAASLLNMIPLLLLVVAFAGGMHLAIDGMAGERERKSLEPLLVNPVGRGAIIIGKWLATSVVAMGYLLLTAVGFMVAVGKAPLSDIGVKVTLGLPEVLAIALAMLPLALFASSVQMLVALFAKSFKEAQIYVGLLLQIPMIPGLVLAFHPLDPSTPLMTVPVLAQALLVSSTLRGDPPHALWLAIAGGITLAAAAGVLAIATKLLGHERIIFGR